MMKNYQTPGVEIQRNEFFKYLALVNEASVNNQKLMALILIDVNNYSEVEQHRGFSRAESYVRYVYDKILSISTYEHSVFRISEGQIAFILPVMEHENYLLIAANKAISLFDDTVIIEQQELMVDLSLGVSVNDIVNSSIEKLFQNATRYLLAAKAQGKSFIMKLADVESPRWKDLPGKIDLAILNNEMELYYQPKVSLEKNLIKSAEALMRWEIEPGDFVPPDLIFNYVESDLEKNFKLTKWVINAALRQQQDWLKQGVELCVSVNVSALLICLPDIVTVLEDGLTLWQVPSHLLMLEITETAMMTNQDASQKVLHQIRQLGVKLSIDDFGTGYSSLSYFKDIPAQELKIDRAFVKDILENEDDRVLVKLIIEISHSFGLNVVAEGVEDLEIYNFLKELGCDIIQGYYISKPLVAEDFLAFLKTYNR